MLAGTIQSLWTYPIKGLPGFQSDTVSVAANGLYDGDRLFAFTDLPESALPADGKITKSRLIAGARFPALARWRVVGRDGETVTYRTPSGIVIFDPDAPGDIIAALEAELTDGTRGPIRFLDGRTDRRAPFTDIATTWISVIDTTRLQDVAAQLSLAMEARRFRANMIVERLCGSHPLQTGQPIRQADGRPVMVVEEETVRCRAIDANPSTGQYDDDRLGAMYRTLGHRFMGFYARAIPQTQLAVGDTLTLDSAPLTASPDQNLPF